VPPRGWATVSVREDVRRALEEIASQKGFSSLNDVIAFLLDKYREFTDISVKLTDISVRCDKLLTDISVKLDKLIQAGMMTPSQIGVSSGNPSAQTATSSTGNVTANSGNIQSTAQSKVKAGYEWCRSKAKVRNLQNFLKWVDDSFGLIDWWEEDDKVCFETRRKPAKVD
jgi:predicted CopG family antitoxin